MDPTKEKQLLNTAARAIRGNALAVAEVLGPTTVSLLAESQEEFERAQQRLLTLRMDLRQQVRNIIAAE